MLSVVCRESELGQKEVRRVSINQERRDHVTTTCRKWGKPDVTSSHSTTASRCWTFDDDNDHTTASTAGTGTMCGRYSMALGNEELYDALEARLPQLYEQGRPRRERGQDHRGR